MSADRHAHECASWHRACLLIGLLGCFSLAQAQNTMGELSRFWNDPLLNFSVAQAQNDVGELAEFLNDPLLTLPPVLESGAFLPGDHVSVQCATVNLQERPLALAEAVDIALCANPQVHSAWAAIKIQAGALGEARAAFLPTAALGLSRLDDRTNYPGTAQDAVSLRGSAQSLGLNWRLFDFGGRAANSRSAANLLDAALASHDAVLQRTLETLISAYFDAQTAKAAWDAKQKTGALAKATVQASQRREAHGAGAQTDTLQAGTALAKAALETSRAKGDYAKTLSVLVYALGVPATTRLNLAPDLADDINGIGKDLDQWLEQTQNRHPAIVAARAQLNAANEKVAATKSDGLPTFDLSANYYKNGRPNQGLPAIQTNEKLVTLTLNFPLFEGFARTYKIRGAQAQAEQKAADLQDTAHQILMDVVKAHADAVSAQGNLESSQNLLDAAQMAVSSVQRKFDRGAADILEMLSTQAALADADQQRVRCLAEWRSARLRLLAASGGLGHWALTSMPSAMK